MNPEQQMLGNNTISWVSAEEVRCISLLKCRNPKMCNEGLLPMQDTVDRRVKTQHIHKIKTADHMTFVCINLPIFFPK